MATIRFILPVIYGFIIGGAAICTAAPAPAKASADPAALLEQGREAFLNYDFDEAARLYGDYASRMKRARKEPAYEFEEYQSQLDMAQRQLERVRDIVVIDSVNVPAVDFFRSIRIPASAGFLLPASEIPFEKGRDNASMAYTPESQALMLWAQPDSIGRFSIVESARLTDGTYSQPVYTPDFLNMEGETDFPVLSTDGLTLFYSSDGNESMGGYDIFETIRDASTGEYMPPSNVGMPFNSPFDDYLLVNDEENGVGWWATDRNRLGDRITLYVYVLPEIRTNFEGEPEEAVSRARIDDIRDTWGDDQENIKKYEQLARRIRSIKPGERPKPDEFMLPIGAGKYYTRFDQLPSADARRAVKDWLAAKKTFDKKCAHLDELRRKYDKTPSVTLADQIIKAESETAADRKSLSARTSALYRILKK